MAMTAWLWSGVVTVMASMTFSFSSMRRKSRYLAAFSYMALSAGSRSSLRMSRAIISSSTSQRATMFSERTPRVSEKPMPPTPTQAMLSVSLGAFFFWVAPTTWRGTIMIPAAAVEAAPRNFRRLQEDSAGEGVFFVSSMFIPSLSESFDGWRGSDGCLHGTGRPMPRRLISQRREQGQFGIPLFALRRVRQPRRGFGIISVRCGDLKRLPGPEPSQRLRVSVP